MRLSTLRTTAVAVFTAVPMLMVATAAPAFADPPPNDNRADAQVVVVPTTVTGTTVDATVEPGEQLTVCDGQSANSVWYKFTADTERGVVAKLAADGNLDAEVDIYKQRRSQLDFVACDLTDDQGLAATRFRVTDGATYFIRVAEQPNSEHDTFTLKLLQGPPPAQPPGKSLASGHAKGTLDRVLKVDAAYHLHLKAGKPYRFNLVHDPSDCQSFALYPPGTDDFDSTSPVLFRGCGGYAVYAPSPGTGGRYFIRITADRNDREDQPYRLLAGPAQRNDLAPGRLLLNHTKHTGSVNGGGLDVKDVYRFGVHHHSSLDLHLAGEPGHDVQLELRKGSGKRISCACGGSSRESISLKVKAGRYYVDVRSLDQKRTHYVLKRNSRTITHTTTYINGRSRTHVQKGQAVVIGVAARPGAKGKSVVNIQHFDPFEGWLPYRQFQVKVHDGKGTLRWKPPTLGRWRVASDYLGTRDFAPSASDYAHLLVAKPLQQHAMYTAA